MSENTPNVSISTRQVELAVGRLEFLSTLPCIAAQYIPKIINTRFQPSTITEIVQSDPALSVRILSLFSSYGTGITNNRFSVGNAIDKLQANIVRDALLSLKVTPLIDTSEQAPDRKGLLKHSLSVACFAKSIVEIASLQMDAQIAYFAGLLHDIGKFALIEVMPRSFYRIAEVAQAEKRSCSEIEQRLIGLDHTLIGKHLAEKWQLPDLVRLSIWLHHSINEAILHEIPEAKMAAAVQLADTLAREAEIGNSGSFDLPESAENLAGKLGINSEQLQQIRQKGREETDKKIAFSGLDAPDALQKYLDSLQAATVQLAGRDSEFSGQIRQLQGASSHFNFVKDFLLSVKSGASALDIAENFASRWQKFYQTGKVCLYMLPHGDSQTLEAVVVGGLSQSEAVLLNVPAEEPVIPKNIANDFAIINADDNITWLLEQLETDFDLKRTRFLPLLCGNKAAGVIIFELNYPSDLSLFEEQFKTSSKIGGLVLASAMEKNREQIVSERLTKIISTIPQEKPSKPVPEEKPAEIIEPPLETVEPEAVENEIPAEPETFSSTYSLEAIAELAAGAAHELNNPLSVISGRAQLLAEAEQNQEKKQILQQIQQNANEASEIIEDLMSFAEPPPPRLSRISISQIIDEALQLAGRKVKTEHINSDIQIANNIKSLFIDSAQVVSSIANIICNAVESYGLIGGLVKINVEPAESGDFVKLIIEDNGCGMSSETLKKATQPFFSAKPAGRKRGMGLAYAARLIQLNKGSLSIASEEGKGTTVSIYLPTK